MCIAAMVDADVLHRVLASKKGEGDADFRGWIRRRHGLLVHARLERYLQELRNERVMELIDEYRMGQHLLVVGEGDLEKAERQLRGSHIRSNDAHMLALALASDTLVLCSGDAKLRLDFTDAELLPKVGRRPRCLYPVDGPGRQRRQFLNRRKCPHRT